MLFKSMFAEEDKSLKEFAVILENLKEKIPIMYE
jgi:hypothetical protein